MIKLDMEVYINYLFNTKFKLMLMNNYSFKLIVLTVLAFWFNTKHANAQVENVIVENYYQTDSIDATDSTGLPIKKGTKTYRIYIDLKTGCKLRKIYGDANHILEIKSSDTIWNNTDNGISFAFEQNKNRLGDNTVALDSWLTIGQISKSTPAPPFFGIIKSRDTNGSVIGGIHNDGGSMGIPEGLLTNSNNWMGIALTSADGIDTFSVTPSNWISYGIINTITGDDSTIFGSLQKGKEFISHNAGLQNSGTMGSDTANQLLVAQITTLGELTFKLNIEIEEPTPSGSIIKKYVSDKSNAASDETYSAYLSYPLECGCTDFNYIEYDPTSACEDKSKCLTKIVFGCMDSTACNYDKSATYNIQELCCYPGYCNDRNLNEVCPLLYTEPLSFFIYPNPASSTLQVEVKKMYSTEISYSIIRSDGTFQIKNAVLSFANAEPTSIDISELTSGIYMFSLTQNGIEIKKSFVKE